MHIIESTIYWLIFTEALESDKCTISTHPPVACPTFPAMENTTILKEPFFISDC